MPEHNTLTGAQNHEPIGIEAALDGQVYIANGLGSGTWSDKFTNIVEVTELADLPSPVASVITPEANTGYYISGSVDIGTNVISITNPGVAILGLNRATDLLITNSTSPLITSSSQNVVLQGLSLANNNASGDILDLSNGGTNVALIDKVIFADCNNIGTIGDFQNVIMDNCGLNPSSPIGGITFTGTNHTEILIRDSFFSGFSGTMFDLGTATSKFIEFVGARFLGTASDVAIDGLNAGGNIQTGGLGTITNCLFDGMTNPIGSNIDHADQKWFFTDVIGAQESTFLGETAMTGNSTATVISSINTWVKVAGTTVPAPENERFIQTADNELEADVLQPRPIDIFVNVSAIKSGGGTDTVQFAVFKDSGSGFTQLSPNNVSSIAATTNIASTSLLLTDTAFDGDKYSVYTQNTSSTSNVEVNDLQFFIRG